MMIPVKYLREDEFCPCTECACPRLADWGTCMVCRRGYCTMGVDIKAARLSREVMGIGEVKK